MSVGSRENYIHFRAPRENGEVLCLPTSQSIIDGITAPHSAGVAGGLAQNQLLLNHCTSLIGDSSLAELRKQARQELSRHLGIETHVDQPWFVSGHQPELFHPGGWLKNFVLDRMAKTTQGIAINLIVDQDLCHSVSIKTPHYSSSDQLRLESVPWDTAPRGVAWELHHIAAPDIFQKFPEQIRKNLKTVDIDPMVDHIWELINSQTLPHQSIGTLFANARHQMEKRHGLANHETPSGTVARLPSFWKLVLHLAYQRSEFHQVHQAALEHYRLAHRIRSAAHPVPSLQRTGDYYEIPLWCYSIKQPRRRPVYVKINTTSFEITDLADVTISWPRSTSEEVIMQRLTQLQDREGIFLRPRALLTTMFLRLCLADWFIHGIGGGKYDQLNDRIIAAFFNMQPPKFSVISGTAFLPISTESISLHNTNLNDTLARLHQTKQLPQRIRYRPEDYLTQRTVSAEQLISEKEELLREIPPKGQKKAWHQQLATIRAELFSLTRFSDDDHRTRISELQSQVQQLKLIRSREYSFCLFPEEQLIGQLQTMSQRCWP